MADHVMLEWDEVPLAEPGDLRLDTGGLGDAPWPPHFRKQRGEPRRVQPSRAREEG